MAWQQGLLEYKLHSTQQKIRAALAKATRRKFFLLCSRRLGKTHAQLALAFEQSIQKPGSRTVFLAPYAKDATEIATDIAAKLLDDCPESFKPKIDVHNKVMTFHNGSVIRLRGVNSESADSLRGGAADLIILDECGQMDNLQYVVQSVCMPMVLTTNGRILLATTPAISSSHDSTAIYKDLKESGNSVLYTLLDAPEDHISWDRKFEWLLECGEDEKIIPDILAGKRLPETTTALREYFCRFVTDASKAVLPEMLRHEHEIVRAVPRPPVCDKYVAIDPGFADKTGIVFGYYDFVEGRIVVEEEALLARASTSDIATCILDTEYRLWRDDKPYLRVIDNNPRLAADLFERHGLVFGQAYKPDALGGINYLRTMLRTGEFIVDPKCTRLVDQMKDAVWNNNATDFAKGADGHFDLLSAARYLARSVNRHHNPFPAGWRPPPGYNPGQGNGGGAFYSPRRRFWPQKGGLDLLGATPLGKRLGKKG